MTDETYSLTVDCAGEVHQLDGSTSFVIGREGDLVIDDNPYLHRHFIEFSLVDGLWWVRNVGSRIAAFLTDGQGLMRTSLAAGARLPLVFPSTLLTFTAGATAYEVILTTDVATYETQQHRVVTTGDTTISPTTFTETQLLAILALAEPLLRRAGSGAAEVPAAVDAARRLGWAQTRFNRKLDNVCDKLTRAGVRGLHGSPGAEASNRRLQLVEYAVSTLLVTRSDLPLLDREARKNATVLARAAQGHPIEDPGDDE